MAKAKIAFTSNQKSAINAKNVSLIVSAAAGSGKTAVLTERILQRLSDPADPADISKLLVVTFTRSAAAELKDRLYKKLDEACLANPSDKLIRRQLNSLSSAKISTIHSFCFNIVKQNFFALGLPSKLRISDPAEAKMLRNACMEEIVNAYFENSGEESVGFKLSCNNYGDFLYLADLCSAVKSDRNFSEMLIKLYEKLSSFPLPLRMLNESTQKLCDELSLMINEKANVNEKEREANCDAVLKTVTGSVITVEALKAVRAIKSRSLMLKDAASTSDKRLGSAYLPAFESDIALFAEAENAILCNDSKTLMDLIGASESAKKRLNPLRIAPDEKKLIRLKNAFQKMRDTEFTQYKDVMSSLGSLFRESVKSEYEINIKLNRVLTELLTDFRQYYSSEKLKHGILDYSDLEHYAFISLVKPETFNYSTGEFERTPFAVKCSKEIDEIYIDEYQDTNMLQDAIFRAVSRKRNMFAVGDPKQSIYGFRGALPEIFTSYRNNCGDYSAENPDDRQRIFLSDNFRCDESVVSFVNTVCEKLLNTDPDNLLYGKNDRLVKSKLFESGFSCEIAVIDKSPTAAQTEAGYIAKKIKELLSENIITDSGRPLCPDDIAVLARKADVLIPVKQELESIGIDSVCAADDKFTESAEILFMTSLLNAIDNPYRDEYLIGTLASPVFCFSSDDLFRIRLAKKDSPFYEALKSFTSEDMLSDKVTEFLYKLSVYRNASLKYNALELIRYLYSDTDIFSAFTSVDKAVRICKKKNLVRLTRIAQSYIKANSGGLGSFIPYLASFSGADSEASVSEDGGSVKLMTMHKAKGLEFPVCILCGLGSNPNERDLSGSVVFSSKTGPAFLMLNDSGTARFNTVLRRAAISELKKQMRDEEKRVLYVAMTRARQKLIVCGTMDGTDKLNELICPFPEHTQDTEFIIQSLFWAKTPLEMILTCISDNTMITEAFKKAGRDDYDASSVCVPGLTVNIVKGEKDSFESSSEMFLKGNCCDKKYIQQTKFSRSEADNIIADLTFIYPYSKLTEMPKKLSVSQLYRGLNDFDHIEQKQPEQIMLASGNFTRKDNSYDAAFAGTSTHLFMQFCDFDICIKSGTEYEAGRLVDENYISVKNRDFLNHRVLKAFFASDLFNRIRLSEYVKRELRFNVFMKASELFSDGTSSENDSDILVQGVIDCFFKNDDGTYTVMDYKTDRVQSEDILWERYSAQLKLYKKAVEKMTGSRVSKIVIYSFNLGRETEITLTE